MKNKYVRRSKISEDKFRKIIRYFCLELDSQKIASLTCLNRNTIDRYLNRIRERIYTVCSRQSPFIHRASLQADENVDMTPVFGLKANGVQVHTDLIPAVAATSLRHCLKIAENGGALCLPQRWVCYDAIVDMASRQLTMSGGEDRTDGSRVIEAFISFAKKHLFDRRLADGVRFSRQLKEYEFRFNHREDDLYQLMLKMFRESPLN